MSIERKFWKVTRWARAARFWLFLLLALAAFLGLGVGEARAQSQSGNLENCNDPLQYSGAVSCPSEAAAMAALNSFVSGNMGNPNAEIRYIITEPYCNAVDRPASSHDCGASVSFRIGSGSWQNRSWVRRVAKTPCPPGEMWDEVAQSCTTTCANRSPLGAHSAIGSTTVCSGGCQFEQGAGVCLGTGPGAYCYGSSWTPTGSQCQAGDVPPSPHNPNQETCRSTGGGWNECIKPDGRHCVTGAKGTRMCWQPGETGKRQDASKLEWADRVPEGETPAPPDNLEGATQETTTTDKGGVHGGGVGGSFVIGGGSATGNKGGQSDTGEGGSGPGTGNGNGDGEGNEPGAPGGAGGALYEGHDKTVASVYAAFRSRISAAPIVSAVDGYFSAPSGGGSCPVWTVPANQYLPAFTFDFFCSPALQSIINMAGYLILLVAAYKAFHIAIGD